MRAVLAVIVIAACGRIGFDPHAAATDAQADVATADATNAVLVQETSTMNSGSGAALVITPTQAGDLVVVTVTQETSAATTVTGVSDGTDTFVSAGLRSVDNGCNNTAEIWYATNVQPGQTAINVFMSASSTIEVWVLELAGVTAYAGGALVNDQAASGMILAAPGIALAGPGVVVSVEATCSGATAIAPDSSFTGLAAPSGEDTAYLISGAAGTYGAVWTYSGGTWNASTAAFR